MNFGKKKEKKKVEFTILDINVIWNGLVVA
jgi:hypothetical protein